jgi:hypothetical protein
MDVRSLMISELPLRPFHGISRLRVHRASRYQGARHSVHSLP